MRKNLLKISILAVLIASLTMVSVVTSTSEVVIDVDPPINSGTAGTTFTINITIAGITEEESLYAWQFGMSFDPDILEVPWYVVDSQIYYNFTEGPFLKSAGFTWFAPSVNNEAGIVGGFCDLLGYPPTGAYGNGTLASILFRVKAEGNTHLPYYGSLLIHYNGTDDIEIEHNVFHGWFLSVFTILGDIDGDSSVDSPDLELFASSYGKMFGDPNYNWLADLDRDGDVDSNDLHLLARNYGKSVGP